ncbi:MAG TPA: hypothetical protein VGM86_17005, partial [Thermoanaerobaculia bacterium]
MNKTSPFLLLILGLLVGFPAAKLAIAPPAKPEVPAKGAPAETPRVEPVTPAGQASLDSQDCKPEAAKGPGAATASAAAATATATATAAAPSPLHPWCMPVRLLRDFFSLPAAAEKPRGESLKEIVAQAKATNYDLRFMVALVPALPDPRMDQALDAIQRAFADSKTWRRGFPPAPDDYLLDRVWLPWVSAGTGTAKPAPSAPGILLFRGTEPRALEAVLLVPETSKMGIQKDTFREALELIAGLQGAAVEPTVAILGPSFSGSVESIRLALTSWRQSRGNLLSFRAASGSATADGLEEAFNEVDVSFCRAALPDSVLQVQALGFLQQKMGWNLRKVGLLIEDDTRYGQSFVNPRGIPLGGGALGQKLVLFTFPSHLSDLRTAWEDAQKAEQAAQANPLQTPRRVLGLDLSGHEQEVDLVPTFSSTTTSINDLLVANLLQTIAREGIRYVGIVSTDPMDKLFLAEKLRQLAPDVVLFTFDNNLLYAHPDHAVELDGMLVLGSYPLFTEGAPGFPALAERWISSAEERWQFSGERRQFGSEYQEGVFEAARYLLGATPLPAPQAWIAAVGNGSLWPIARLPVERAALGTAHFCSREPGPALPATARPARSRQAGVVAPQDGFDDKDDLQILLVAGLFCLLAIGLHRAALLDEIPGGPVDPDDGRPIHDPRGNHALLMAGTGLLAAGTGVLLTVATVPIWSHRWSEAVDVARSTALSQWIYLLVLVAAYGWLVLGMARAAHGERPGLRRVAVWMAGGLAAFVLLILAVFWLCVPG